eukprot:scaffold12841_cov63-Phaeocystis_antarctica.AAC.2
MGLAVRVPIVDVGVALPLAARLVEEVLGRGAILALLAWDDAVLLQAALEDLLSGSVQLPVILVHRDAGGIGHRAGGRRVLQDFGRLEVVATAAKLRVEEADGGVPLLRQPDEGELVQAGDRRLHLLGRRRVAIEGTVALLRPLGAGGASAREHLHRAPGRAPCIRGQRHVARHARLGPPVGVGGQHALLRLPQEHGTVLGTVQREGGTRAAVPGWPVVLGEPVLAQLAQIPIFEELRVLLSRQEHRAAWPLGTYAHVVQQRVGEARATLRHVHPHEWQCALQPLPLLRRGLSIQLPLAAEYGHIPAGRRVAAGGEARPYVHAQGRRPIVPLREHARRVQLVRCPTTRAREGCEHVRRRKGCLIWPTGC